MIWIHVLSKIPQLNNCENMGGFLGLPRSQHPFIDWDFPWHQRLGIPHGCGTPPYVSTLQQKHRAPEQWPPNRVGFFMADAVAEALAESVPWDRRWRAWGGRWTVHSKILQCWLCGRYNPLMDWISINYQLYAPFMEWLTPINYPIFITS